MPAIAMPTDICLKDLRADSILALGVEGKGKKGTLSSSTSERSIRDFIWSTWDAGRQQKGSSAFQSITYAA